MELHSEIDWYLSLDVKHVADPLLWWQEHKLIYPQLSRMALDYLSIPRMLCCNSFFSLI